MSGKNLNISRNAGDRPPSDAVSGRRGREFSAISPPKPTRGEYICICIYMYMCIYRVSQEECEILRESVPYVKL